MDKLTKAIKLLKEARTECIPLMAMADTGSADMESLRSIPKVLRRGVAVVSPSTSAHISADMTCLQLAINALDQMGDFGGYYKRKEAGKAWIC